MTTLAGVPPAQPDSIARPAELATVRVTLRRSSRPAHVVVRGEVTSATISQLQDALHAAAAELPRFVVDVTGAQFLDHEGIRLLYLYREHIIAALATADSIIAQVLTVAGYPTVLLREWSRPDVGHR
jgi:hypothetical protein